jgi:hypothetical protein
MFQRSGQDNILKPFDYEIQHIKFLKKENRAEINFHPMIVRKIRDSG